MNISLFDVHFVLQAVITVTLIGMVAVLLRRVNEIRLIELALMARAATLEDIRKQQAARLAEHEERMSKAVGWTYDEKYVDQVAALNRQIDTAMK